MSRFYWINMISKKKLCYGITAIIAIMCIIGGAIWKGHHQAKTTAEDILLTIVQGVWDQGVFTVSEAAAVKPIIKANIEYYDVNTGLYVLKGNVYIKIRNQKITAGQAKASLATLEIWGSEGISFTQDDMYLTADSVHVINDQTRALIEGKVSFKRGGLAITADQADLNWYTKLALFKGNVTVCNSDDTRTMDTVTYNVETNSLQ